MDIKLIGMAAVAGLCDAVADLMTGQLSGDEKAALMAEVECDDRADIERFYKGARTAFERDPGNAVSLFLLVSLDDIRTLPPAEQVVPLRELLAALEAAHYRGLVTVKEAAEVMEQVSMLQVVGEADGR